MPQATKQFALIAVVAGAAIARCNEQLRSAGLPDVIDPRVIVFQFMSGGEVAGYVGLESEGSDVLLRSFVVLPENRGSGWGSLLLDATIQEARQRGARRLWLLTTTAEPFFAKRGFMRVDRATAPAAIQATGEFASICPTSAACMWRAI